MAKRSMNQDNKKSQQSISIRRWVLDSVHQYADDNKIYISDLFEEAIIKFLAIKEK